MLLWLTLFSEIAGTASDVCNVYAVPLQLRLPSTTALSHCVFLNPFGEEHNKEITKVPGYQKTTSGSFPQIRYHQAPVDPYELGSYQTDQRQQQAQAPGEDCSQVGAASCEFCNTNHLWLQSIELQRLQLISPLCVFCLSIGGRVLTSATKNHFPRNEFLNKGQRFTLEGAFELSLLQTS